MAPGDGHEPILQENRTDERKIDNIDKLDLIEEKIEHVTKLISDIDHFLVGFGAERFRAPFYYLGNNRGLTYLETGHPFFVNTSDCALTPWLIMGGHWETWADRVVSSYLRPGMKVIDVGANVGYYSVKWGSMIGPSGELHAFEPNPEMTQFLYENFTLNGLHGHCRLHCHAVGAEHGTAVLTFTDHNTGAGTIRDAAMPPGGVKSYPVGVAPLDSVLEHMSHVDLMKIDVEEPRSSLNDPPDAHSIWKYRLTGNKWMEGTSAK
jgi:FkbM family methyltransferase